MRFKIKTGETVLVDDADAPMALAFTWHRSGDGYIAHSYRDEHGHPRCFYLKELLTGLRNVRFRNRNRCDHRRRNLVLPSHPCAGVRYRRGFWEVYAPRYSKYYGRYATLEAAVAERLKHGKALPTQWTLPEAAKGKDRVRRNRAYLRRLYQTPTHNWRGYYTGLKLKDRRRSAAKSGE